MKKHTFNIPVELSNLLKVIACIVILLHHYSQFGLDSHRISGPLYEILRSVVGDLSVTLFFFLSGYGLMVAESRRPFELKRFVTKRFWRVLKPFWLVNLTAVVLYWILNANNVATQSPLLALGSVIGIVRFDVTMWFVHYLLALYILFAIGMLLHKPVLLVSGAVLAFIVTAIILQMPSHIWSSLFAFPFGMVVGKYPDAVIRFFRRYEVVCISTIIYASLLYFIVLGNIEKYGPLWHQINNILLIVILLFLIGRIPMKYINWYKISPKLQPYYEVYLIHPKILFVTIFCIGFFPPLWLFISMTAFIALVFCNIGSIINVLKIYCLKKLLYNRPL